MGRKIGKRIQRRIIGFLQLWISGETGWAKFAARPYIRSMAEIMLTLEGVTVQMGGAKLLDRLDWTIRRNEQWAVVGPSGAGKTVLAHTLLGLHFAMGRVAVDGLKIVMVRLRVRSGHRNGRTASVAAGPVSPEVRAAGPEVRRAGRERVQAAG